MKIKKYSFTILIASILVGYLIIVNVSDKESTIKTMNIKICKMKEMHLENK